MLIYYLLKPLFPILFNPVLLKSVLNVQIRKVTKKCWFVILSATYLIILTFIAAIIKKIEIRNDHFTNNFGLYFMKIMHYVN